MRSKLYLGYYETSEAAQDDFEAKLEFLFPDEDVQASISFVSVMNPSFGPDAVHNSLIKRFGPGASVWEENCAGAIFFSEGEDSDDEDDDVEEMQLDSYAPTSDWMFKYEIYFSEDSIEFTRNGEYVFSPAQIPHTSMTSSYH